MATCNICHGGCYLPTGRYESCYSCGGRGYGSDINQACSACGGSGKSTTEIKEICWQCHGSGIVADPPRYSPTPSSNKTASTSRATSDKSTSATTTNSQTSDATSAKGKSKPPEAIATIALLIAIAVGFIVYDEHKEIKDALITGVVAYIASALSLYVLFYVVKAAIEILKLAFLLLFWGGVALFIGYQLKFQWAVNLTAYLQQLI